MFCNNNVTTTRQQMNIKAIVCLFFTSLTIQNASAKLNTRNEGSVAYRNAYQRVSAGWQNTMEIRGGALWAWGNNDYGQLGIGNTIEQHTPVQVGAGNNWQSVSCGYGHTVGLKSDGTLWAWGWNVFGQLGIGNNTDQNVPMQVGTGNNWISVSCGDYHTVALKSDGTLWVWGNNAFYQLGIGNFFDQNTPVQVGTSNTWVSVFTRRYTTLALRSDGTLWAWGLNNNGQLGIGNYTDQSVPVQVGTGNTWVGVSCGDYSTIGLRSDGTLWSWGDNSVGQLGIGNYVNQNTPVQVGTGNTWVSVSSGEAHSLALKSDGTLWSWGDNGSGELGIGNNTSQNTPVQVGAGNTWVSISCGGSNTIGLKSDGTLWAWGWNYYGQLGIGNTISQNSPVQTSVQQSDWLMTSCGFGHTAAVRSDGTLWTWGLNIYGQLGIGNNINQYTPVQVGTGSTWVSVSCGDAFTIGLKADGTLWAWGSNGEGALGIGNNTNQNAPVQIGTGNTWVSVSCGGWHTTALRADGSLWTWGSNGSGQLGIGNNNDQNAPVQVGAGTWLGVFGGGSHTMAIKPDGTLWAWGYNTYGQLGIGNNTNQNTPVQVGAGNAWVSVAGGGNHSIALRSDGTLWAAGYNNNGQLGIGNNTNQNTTIQVGTGTTWVNVSSGSSYSLASKSDGTLWSWGYNANGQLGIGNNTNQSSPIAVSGQADIVCLFRGPNAYHSAIIKVARDKICLTGSNSSGQLGDGTLNNQSTFNCITVCAAMASPTIVLTKNVPDTFCTGTPVIFTATITNGGTSPHYQWYKNGNAAGLDQDTYTDNGLNDLDSIRCVLTSNATCITSSTASSATDTVHVNPLLAANISIDASPNDTICSGTTVTLTATVSNAGATPAYQWYVNGSAAGTNQNTYTTSLFNDSDVVNCVLTSAYACPTQATVTSADDTIRWKQPNATLAGFTGGVETNMVNVEGDEVVSYTDCDLMATIQPGGANPLNGSSTVKVTIDNTISNYNGQPYLQRHYDIEPANNAANATATITLYAYQSEFDAYNLAAQACPPLPTGGIDNGNVRITQFHGTGTVPGNYTGGEVLITPTVNWDATNGWWVMTFPVNGFSGFYIHTAWGAHALNITISNIGAQNEGARNRVDWISATETKGALYTIERSADGRNFTDIGHTDAKGIASSYTYWDENPFKGINYYRLRVNETNGASSYTRVVNANVKNGNAFNISAWPNPVHSSVMVRVYGTQTGNSYLSITDLSGKELKRVQLSGADASIDLGELAAGIYMLKYSDDARTETIGIAKY